MTPKEKALQLKIKFTDYDSLFEFIYNVLNDVTVKQDYDEFEYWMQVKHEIEQL
jgi:hypothetical protein